MVWKGGYMNYFLLKLFEGGGKWTKRPQSERKTDVMADRGWFFYCTLRKSGYLVSPEVGELIQRL